MIHIRYGTFMESRIFRELKLKYLRIIRLSFCSTITLKMLINNCILLGTYNAYGIPTSVVRFQVREY